MLMLIASSLSLFLSGVFSLNLEHHSHQAGHVELNKVDALLNYTLENFVQEFNRTYKRGTDEWKKREQLFKEHHSKVLELRVRKDRSWTPGITRFMDYSDDEYRRLLGYRGRRSRAMSTAAKGRQASTEPASASSSHNYTFPPLFTTATKGKLLTALVRDQGQCGSCWAAAAMSVLEGAAETYPDLLRTMRRKAKQLNTPLETLSSEAMVSCTPNLKNCGGTGGCDGATAELGYELVMEKGLPLAAEWPYSAGSVGHPDECEDKHFNTDFRVTISGYTVLPSNQFNPLIEALTKNGHPIAIAVDATYWNYYDGGIYSDTDESGGEFTVNHEVSLVGFKLPPATQKKNDRGYYLIKNSWGESWGERGFIRVEMKADEAGHCGWDTDTHIGLACDGDPDKAWVCGTCGILYDACFPTGLKEFGK